MDGSEVTQGDEDEMITVMGATGNTGLKVAKLLVDAGEDVRALGRSSRKLEARLGGTGVERIAGDPADAGFLTEAFRDADAAYALLPYDPRSPGYLASQTRLGEAITRAVGDSRIGHVVYLSSIGADRAAGPGLLAGHHAQEGRLRSLGAANVLVLRAGAFFENMLEAIESIERDGVVADTVAPDVKVPMVASGDIAAVAAWALRARYWSGFVVRELLGSADLSYAEATSISGRCAAQVITQREDVAVSGQSAMAATGQILLSAHTVSARRAMGSPLGQGALSLDEATGRPVLVLALCEGQGVSAVHLERVEHRDGAYEEGPTLWRIEAVEPQRQLRWCGLMRSPRQALD